MKYDKHHIDKIIEALANGDGRVRACQKANISYETFTEWMQKVEFSEAVKKAEDCGNDKIKDICKRRIIEDKSWQSGAWWLERNYPNEYKQRTDTTSNDKTIALQINVAKKEDVEELNDWMNKPD